jgi:hypothetical protein
MVRNITNAYFLSTGTLNLTNGNLRPNFTWHFQKSNTFTVPYFNKYVPDYFSAICWKNLPQSNNSSFAWYSFEKQSTLCTFPYRTVLYYHTVRYSTIPYGTVRYAYGQRTYMPQAGIELVSPSLNTADIQKFPYTKSVGQKCWNGRL